jgi:endonuclease/exonuclease/phosphatase family metal-dependent hydrolase
MNKGLKKIPVVCVFFVVTVFAQYPATLKVMTYNINAEKNGPNSYGEVANVIKNINPDICGLQKIDSCASIDTLDVSKWLGEKTDKVNTFAVAVKNYKSSSGSYGVAFLSNEEPASVRRLWLEHTKNEMDRGVLEIGITVGGEKARIIVTHLAHETTEDFRSLQIKKIIPWIDSAGKDDPVIIMADFNAPPTENSMKLFETAGFAYVKSKNNLILDTSNGQKINHILYRPQNRWQVVDAGNPAYSNVSNRNPVWADMKVVPSIGIVEKKCRVNNEYCPIRSHGNTIDYSVETGSYVSLSLYTLSGLKVADLVKNQYINDGAHSVNFNCIQFAKGMYTLRYISGRQVWNIPVCFL